MGHTVKEMCDICHITSRTFYRAVKQNEDFRKMVEETKVETPKGSTYGDSVLDWLKKKYLPDAEEQETPTMPVEPPSSPAEPSDGVECIIKLPKAKRDAIGDFFRCAAMEYQAGLRRNAPTEETKPES